MNRRSKVLIFGPGLQARSISVGELVDHVIAKAKAALQKDGFVSAQQLSAQEERRREYARLLRPDERLELVK